MSRLVLLLTVVALAAACTDGVTPISDPVAIRIVSGNQQSGVVGSELPNAIVVRVDDADGNPFSGQPLVFSVTAGGGSLSDDSLTTDANGQALARWTLGTAVADTHKVEVRGTALTTGQPLPPALLSAIPLADVPVGMQKTAGDAQVGDAGTFLPESLRVRVTDQYQNPAAGVVVTWTVISGGGGISSNTTSTDTSGSAAVAFLLGSRLDTLNQVDAVTEGLGSVTFTATAELPPASNFRAFSGDNQTGIVNADLAQPLSVAINLPAGPPASGVEVTWTVSSGGGSVNPTSAKTTEFGSTSTVWTLGQETGVQQVTASVSGLADLTFTADALPDVPVLMIKYAGDNQLVPVGSDVVTPPAVLLKDSYDNPVPGVPVGFSVTGGGGSVTGATDTTDVDGIASVGSWTLGLGTNTLEATATAPGVVGNPATFSAVGVVSNFDIEVRFSDSSLVPTPTQRAAFDNAAARWASMVVGDLSDVALNLSAGTCANAWFPDINETVDDVVIFASLDSIDGAFGILGQAGPCFIRTANALPVLGGMRFDVADLTRLENDGELELVILHEMAHVLGFGTLWNTLGLLQNPSSTTGPIVDTYFSGATAIANFNSVGGTAYTAGNKVPVENDNTRYGLGSLNGHWRESVFGTELMTPSLNSGVANQLSVVSVASLEDLGYQVSLTATDPYTWPAPLLAAGAGSTLLMIDDVWLGPIYLVDAMGNVTGVVERR